MNFTDLAKTVAQYAPLLGAVLPLPGGELLGQAIAKTFGADINKPEDIIKKIKSDPQANLKLLEIQSNEKVKLEELAVQKLQTLTADVANARQREIEISKYPIEHQDKVPATLAKMFLIGYFSVILIVICAIWVQKIDSTEMSILVELIKDLGLATMVILTYYYGASNKK